MPLGLKKKIYDARGSKKEAMALINKYTPYGGFKAVQRRGYTMPVGPKKRPWR
jgi:hypothetical protein